MSAINFTQSDKLDRAITSASSHPDGVGFAELLRAAASGRIAFTVVTNHRDVWTPRSLKVSLPTVVLIGDDASDSRDPNEWRCAISAIAWARCAIVHGTGAQGWHYREAIAGAIRLGRCLFVETDSAHVAAWVAALAPRQIPVLSIVPTPGTGSHPVSAGERIN